MRQTGILLLAALTAILLSQELALSLPIRGVGPDVLIMVVVGYAMGVSPRQAALVGFAAGFFRDLLITTPAGLSAFAYAVTAYVAALIGAVRGAWVFAALVAGAAFFSQLLYGLGTVLVAHQVDVSPLPRVAVLTTLYDALLAPLLMPLLRKLSPAEPAGAGAVVE